MSASGCGSKSCKKNPQRDKPMRRARGRMLGGPYSRRVTSCEWRFGTMWSFGICWWDESWLQSSSFHMTQSKRTFHTISNSLHEFKVQQHKVSVTANIQPTNKLPMTQLLGFETFFFLDYTRLILNMVSRSQAWGSEVTTCSLHDPPNTGLVVTSVVESAADVYHPVLITST